MEFNPEPDTAISGRGQTRRARAAAIRCKPPRDGGRRVMTARAAGWRRCRAGRFAPTCAQTSRPSRRRPAARRALRIVLVGDDPASELYVGSKLKSAGETGLRADLERLPATASLDGTARARRTAEPQRRARRHPRAVAAAAGDGPRRRAAGVRRDRSGEGRRRASIRSTSAGSCRAAPRWSPARRRASSSCSSGRASRSPGARAVVIGRSDIVGKPMALLLLHRNATVTICHSRTVDLPQRCARGRHSGRGDRTAGVRHARVRQAGRDRRSTSAPRRSTDRAFVERLFPPGSKRHTAFEQRGALVLGDVHPAVRTGGRSADARARRRRTADDRDAAQEHRARGRRPRRLRKSPIARSSNRQIVESSSRKVPRDAPSCPHRRHRDRQELRARPVAAAGRAVPRRRRSRARRHGRRHGGDGSDRRAVRRDVLDAHGAVDRREARAASSSPMPPRGATSRRSCIRPSTGPLPPDCAAFELHRRRAVRGRRHPAAVRDRTRRATFER